MRLKQRIFGQLAAGIGAIFGRRNLVRYGGFLVRVGRYDLPNSLATNGELIVQEVVLRSLATKHATIIDCGANVGLLSESLIDLVVALEDGPSVQLYCFEPSSFTFGKLNATLADLQLPMIRTGVFQIALSNKQGTSELKIVHEGAGSNSLVEVPGKYADVEQVNTITLDEFSRQCELDHIDLLKIDAEGHDFKVILGAIDLFRQNRIGVVQFEYNWRWIYGKHFLQEVFELLQEWDYAIGKVTPDGIQFYQAYDVQLETFVEANYLACTPQWKSRFKSVESWIA